MNAEVAKLAHLQEVQQEIATLKARIADYGKRVAARESAVAETGRQMDENKKAQEKEAGARRRMESDTDDLRQKAARYRVQLDSAQSDSQAKALEHQIAFCNQEIGRIEDREFASLVETEALETRHRTLHETLAGERQALADEKATAELGRARDQGHAAELARECESLRAEIEAELLEKYDRISSTGKLAVAYVDRQRCSACQMVVRPQRWNEIREGAVHFCESCGRFLAYVATVDPRDEMHAPSSEKKPARQVKSAASPQDQATGSEPAAQD